MSAWAKPGVKCVCVDATPDAGRRWGGTPPVKGRVYTIIRLTGDGYSGKPCAIVDGVNEGWPVRLERFRPIVTRTQSQDVAIFRKLLVPEGADA